MHHRMGSYFDATGVVMSPQGPPLAAPPKKGILIPPPPPPTSSIPGKNKQRQVSVVTSAEIPIRPSLVSKGLGSDPTSTRSERTRRNLQRLKFECNDMKQISALNKRLASLTIADMSPRYYLLKLNQSMFKNTEM